VAGSLCGLAISGGPIVAGIVGITAAGLVAVGHKGPSGDVARASANVVIAVRDTAKRVDEKHGLVDKSQRAANAVVDKVKEMSGGSSVGNDKDESVEVEEASLKQVKGASIAGGLVGFVVLGPMTALVAGVTSAGLAIAGTSTAGNVARTVGDVVSSMHEQAVSLVKNADDEEEEKKKKKAAFSKKTGVGGSAVVGFVTGLVIFGPVMAVVTGTAAAGLAATNSGVAGNIARASGSTLVAAQDEVEKICENYDVIGEEEIRESKKVKYTAANVHDGKKNMEDVGRASIAAVAGLAVSGPVVALAAGATAVGVSKARRRYGR